MDRCATAADAMKATHREPAQLRAGVCEFGPGGTAVKLGWPAHIVLPGCQCPCRGVGVGACLSLQVQELSGSGDESGVTLIADRSKLSWTPEESRATMKRPFMQEFVGGTAFTTSASPWPAATIWLSVRMKAVEGRWFRPSLAAALHKIYYC